jgi:hypothetical protein
VALTVIDQVRLKTSDRPRAYRQQFSGDGERKIFALDHRAITQASDVTVLVNGATKVLTTDYTLDLVNAIVTFVAAPATGAEVVVLYQAVTYTDAEVQQFLDEASGSTVLASAHLLLAWAADAARLAEKHTVAGGGGMGTVTLDTEVTARQLRESAKGYLTLYQSFEGQAVPADGLTEVPWTDQQARDYWATRVLREL